MFDQDIEGRLRDYLLQGSADAWGTSKTETAKKKAESEKKVKAIEEETKKKVAKNKKKQYETIFFETYPNEIANIKIKYWKKENELNKDKELLNDVKKLEEQITENNRQCEVEISKNVYTKYLLPVEITNWFGENTFVNQPIDYIENCKVLNSNYNEDEFSIWKTIKTLGENKFDEQKKKALELAEKLKAAQLQTIKLKNVDMNIQFDNEKALQKIAEIPLTIEEKIEEIRDTLDKLLGKYLDKIINPESPEFDLDVLLAKIQGIIDPLLACIGPLEAVGSKVPILDDLTAIIGLLSSSKGGGQLSKEEIKKIIGQFKPDIDGKMTNVIIDIGEDILAMVQQLPMILINIIFQMIGVIIGLFQQIAGVIGVPGIPYPLSLLPQCINAWPIIQIVVIQLPSLMKAAIKGLIKDKLAEAMALSIPKPNIDMSLMQSLVPPPPEIEIEKPSTVSKPEKKNKDYADVIKEKFEELKKSDSNFNRTDLQRVLKSYKEIYDGSNGSINKYTMDMFEGESGSKLNIFQGVESEGQTVKLKSGPEVITRSQGTPDDFKTKLDTVFSNVKTEDSWTGKKSTVEYDKVKDVSSIVGAKYFRYKSDIEKKEKNPQVVITDTIKS